MYHPQVRYKSRPFLQLSLQMKQLVLQEYKCLRSVKFFYPFDLVLTLGIKISTRAQLHRKSRFTKEMHAIQQLNLRRSAQFIGRIDQYLRKRLVEHIPQYLRRAMWTKKLLLHTDKIQLTSRIAKNSVSTGHIMDQCKSCEILLHERDLEELAMY